MRLGLEGALLWPLLLLLGCGGGAATSARPVEIAGIGRHACMRMSDGTVACAGVNEHGELGDGTVTNRHEFATVQGLSGATQIAVGSNHVCARIGDSTVRCWGWNGSGQLGDNTRVDRSTPVDGLTRMPLGFLSPR